MGLEMGGNFKREGIYVYPWLIHIQKWGNICIPMADSRRRQWQPTPVLLPGKSQDTTERLHFHFSLSCIGGGNASLSLFTLMHWRRRWLPTPVFLPGESQGRESLVGSMGSHRVGHDWSDLAAAAWLIHVEVWQRTAKFYKGIILPKKERLKKKEKKNERGGLITDST